MSSIKTFRNVRARLQRRTSGEWMSGWVTHLVREEARVRLWTPIPLLTNEPIVGECYGQGTLARFSGRLLAQAGQEISIGVIGSISYAPSEETPRICATGLVGQLGSRESCAAMQVLDVSPASLGALVDLEFDPGAELTMDLPSEMGPITARVSVANCRPDPEMPERFRIGMHILDMARLDRARWGRLVAERAEA